MGDHFQQKTTLSLRERPLPPETIVYSDMGETTSNKAHVWSHMRKDFPQKNTSVLQKRPNPQNTMFKYNCMFFVFLFFVVLHSHLNSESVSYRLEWRDQVGFRTHLGLLISLPFCSSQSTHQPIIVPLLSQPPLHHLQPVAMFLHIGLLVSFLLRSLISPIYPLSTPLPLPPLTLAS